MNIKYTKEYLNTYIFIKDKLCKIKIKQYKYDKFLVYFYCDKQLYLINEDVFQVKPNLNRKYKFYKNILKNNLKNKKGEENKCINEKKLENSDLLENKCINKENLENILENKKGEENKCINKEDEESD